MALLLPDSPFRRHDAPRYKELGACQDSSRMTRRPEREKYSFPLSRSEKPLLQLDTSADRALRCYTAQHGCFARS